jgi:hypothetical protein
MAAIPSRLSSVESSAKDDLDVLMKNLTDPRWIKLKGLLFLFLGLIAVVLLLVMHFDAQTAVLLAIAIWSFCRAYYCAFYVIEKYVDGRFRFSGIGAFLLYCVTGKADEAKMESHTDAEKTTNGAPPA